MNKNHFILCIMMLQNIGSQINTTPSDIHSQRILILDFGSQYTQLIARRVREIGVYCELHPYDMPEHAIKQFNPHGIILSGGPETVTHKQTPRASEIVFALGCPVLGICYGMQTMTKQLGGNVHAEHHGEFGHASVTKQKDSPLFAGIASNQFDAWMSHGDQVHTLPSNFEVIAKSNNDIIAAIANESKKFYGLQFHPEVTHTPQGKNILENFVLGICGCKKLWTLENIIHENIRNIHAQVGSDHVLLALSGGVDSSVVAALLHRAIGNQLHCVFVDNGLLRLGEADEVMKRFAQLGISVTKVDARKHFLNALRGITDPEEKRKVIGHEFIAVFEREAQKLNSIAWLAQGTIYPDVIESAQSVSGKAHVIKSHHNVGGLPEQMKLKLVEPLRELFKDEVRRLGIELGLPHDVVYRHPFPGPGLGVRILGEIKDEYITILQQADAIFIQELRNHDLYDKTSQAFCVFLPVKAVGVKGDARRYDYVVALRAVETIDFMTARWADLPYDFLAHVSNRIMNELPGISRVTYDISSKPPATIEWE